jgi:tetratricopeptide (TPR) repeat protein
VILAAVDPGNGTYWNNLGVLRRDIGEISLRAVQDAKPDDILALYQSSYAAYDKALSFSPNDPGYLNDAAVLLQYYLGEDLEKARDYYERAQVEAQKVIDTEGWNSLPADKRADEELRIRTALRDGADNIRKMDRGEVGTRHPNHIKKRRKKSE